MWFQVFSDYFERIVEFLPVDTWFLDEENSASYTLSGDVQPTMWDWIGVFKVRFLLLSLDDKYFYNSFNKNINIKGKPGKVKW